MRRATTTTRRSSPAAHGDDRSVGGLGKGNRPKRQRSGVTPRLRTSVVGALIVLGLGLALVVVVLARLHPATTPRARRPEGATAAGRPVGVTSPTSNATIHLTFSTDCGTFQHWQSYLFFHAALKVGQTGYVTRIASGCTDEQLQEEQAWHNQHIQSKMSERFRIHFTPHFSQVKDEKTGQMKDYKFFNKPFGLKHFLETNELLGLDAAGQMKRPDDVVILADPDFLLLRPLTDDFSDERETLVGPRRQAWYRDQASHVAARGHPYAQAYGLGTQWRKFDLDAIAGSDSPAKDVDQKNGALGYPAGPPYVVAAGDMHDIAVTWSEFAPRVYAQYPHLLAEMYAYCIAAAHLRLPHMLIDSMMVSQSGNGGEGWKLVKQLPAEEVCAFAREPDHQARPVPSVIHYCQRYSVDKFFWSKRKMPHDIFTCEHPLLTEPPLDLGSGKYLSATEPVNRGKANKEPKEISADTAKMHAFVVCALTKATNDAMLYFKDHHCREGANRTKAYDLWAGQDQ